MKNNNLLGITSIVLSMLIFSLQDIAVKGMGGSYPILEIVIFRALMAMPITLLLFRFEGGRGYHAAKTSFSNICAASCSFSPTQPTLWAWPRCR